MMTVAISTISAHTSLTRWVSVSVRAILSTGLWHAPEALGKRRREAYNHLRLAG
jgi:hypothetical protein